MLLKSKSRDIVRKITEDDDEVQFIAVNQNGGSLGSFKTKDAAVSFLHTSHGHDEDLESYGIVSYNQYRDIVYNYDIMGKRTD